MTEPDALIDPEAVAPTAPAPRRRRALLAGVTALALVAGGVVVAAGGGRPEPEPLALMAGTGDGAGRAEMTSGAPAAVPAVGASADSSLAYPYGWGLRFEVAGDLPDLGDRALVWRANGPALDREAVARVAAALGVSGAPEQRDGGWFVDGGDWTLNGYPGAGIWSVNLFRSRLAGADGDAPVPDDTPAGPSLSATDAERRVRDLLDRMGAPAGPWRFETTRTEIGVGWACAAPAPGPAVSPEELRALETEKLRQPEGQAASAPAEPDARPIPADQPATEAPLVSCPPPPAPVEGFDVVVYPRLGEVRADWPVWFATLRSDGRVESLSGTWVTFERGDEYRLRGVDAALEELRSPPPAVRREGGGTETNGAPAIAVDTPAVAVDAPATSGATDLPADTPAVPADGLVAGGSGAGTGGSAGGAPDVLPLEEVPVPVPQVVTITGVELALMQAPVFEEGRARIHLVPAYRFVGRFDDGLRWETLVLALHSDAITPPPDTPVTDDLRSGVGATTGIAKAVPPVPPGAEPAVAVDPDSAR